MKATLSRRTEAQPTAYSDFAQQFVGGTWRRGRSDTTNVDRNPYTSEVLVEIQQASSADLDDAYQAAAKAQQDWAARLPAERAEVMRRAAAIMRRRRDEIIGWVVRESGGTLIKATLEWEAVHGVLNEAATLPYFVEGSIQPADVPGKESRVYRKPVGVVGIISPWNWPMQLTARSLYPALVVGNAAVVKPASDTPITGGLLFAKILEEAGLPEGVLSVVIGAGSEIGDAFVTHDVPRVISFTGSTPVGRRIARLAAEAKIMKRIDLELGGNSPMVVLDDADVERAAEAAVFGKFLHQGQICMIANRIIVDDAIYDAFVEQFVARVRRLKVGDPDDPETMIGPIINQSQLDGLIKKIHLARRDGVKQVLGGEATGLVLPPHVFVDVDNRHVLAHEEIFGPIAPIIRARGEEDALALANDTTFGLSSAVFTRDLERGVAFAQRIQAGMAHVNDQPVNDVPFSPFGGEKNSGIGRFNGRWAVNAFTTEQWITVQRGPRPYPTSAEQIKGPWAGG